MIKEYDKIRLQTGEIGRVLELLSEDVYLAEIFLKNGDIDTTEIKKVDISSVFEEIEHPLAQAM
jgi:hypothetical protein